MMTEIDRMSVWFQQNTLKKQVTGGGFTGLPPLTKTAANLLNDWHSGEQVSQQSIDGLRQALADFAANAQFVTVTLAGLPPAKLKESIVVWFRQNVRADLLVDFNFNRTMLGGMVVRYGSQIADMSFKRQIMANSQKFAEVLRHV